MTDNNIRDIAERLQFEVRQSEDHDCGMSRDILALCAHVLTPTGHTIASLCDMIVRLIGKLRESETDSQSDQEEIARFRDGLEEIVAGSVRRFSLDLPPENLQSLRDHDSGARLAWSVAEKIARAALGQPKEEKV